MNYICLKSHGQAGTISFGIRATARPYNHLMRAAARPYIFQSIYICLKSHGQAVTISSGIRATARPYNHFIRATTCPSNHFIRAAARPYIKPSISLNIEKMKTTPHRRGRLLFSQRNNPYCELLIFCITKLYTIIWISKKITVFLEKISFQPL